MSELTPQPHFEKENIRPAFERSMFLDRQRYPENVEESKSVIDELELLKGFGKHIAVVDGSFDVPHPNHQWYLHHCRILAGRNHLDPEAEGKGLDELAACDEVFLVVTLDTDEKVRQLKTGKSGDQSIKLPVYPWALRAQTISNFMTPTSGNRYRPVVDMVTVDGTPDDDEAPTRSHVDFGRALLERGVLGSWLFYGENFQKKNEAEELVSSHSDTEARIIAIMEDINYSVDEDGRPWHSSSIIRKILDRE